MKNLYTESSYDRNERPRAFPFYQNYQQNTYFAPNQGTEENLLFDPKGISYPINWELKPKFQSAPTEAESRTLNQIQSLAFANVLNNSLVTLGQDPSQGLFLRQLIGQAAMQPVNVTDEDINDAGIASEQTRLNDLMMQPEERLKQEGMGDLIIQSMSKLAYMKARHNNTLVVPDTNIANYYRGQGWFGNIVGGVADMVITAWDNALNFNPANPAPFSPTEVPALQRLGGDGLRVLRSMGFDNTELLADLEKETGSLPSTSTADMVALVESFDPNFDYKTWFNEKIALDPTVRDGLLNYGVTEDLFIQSRNSTHALMTLMSKMNVSDIQRRLSNYVPTTYQSIYGLAASFKDGFIGSLDTAAEVALEIGGTIAVDTAIGAAFFGAPTGGTAAPVGAVVGGAVGLAKAGQILYKAFTAAKKVMSSAWYLTGYGKLPRYAMQWGVIRTTGASALVGATSNSLIDYVGQKENIALANSLYFYNPDMQSVFSMDEVVGAAAAGALFGASLGMIGHVISTVAVRGNNAAARNAFAQQGMDPAFAPQQRNPFQRTKDNIAAFRNRNAVAIQDPIAGAIQTAVSKGVDPTVVDINAAARTTSTAIDAASVASNPKDAANLPDHSLNRRQPNEPMRAFTIRAVLGKFVTSINDLLDADSSGGRFSLLTPREQYLTLLRTEDHMRDFSAMTDIETDLTNKAAGRPEQMRIIDPVTGRSSSPAANVAKLYSELDEARSTLEKTISKEDRIEAKKAYANGTELAPRTISSAVDKATSNVRGIMENASEGRHNPSTAKGPKVEPPATGNAAQGNAAPAKPLYGFDAQWAMAKKAKDMGVDLTKMTREEYAQFAIDNGFLIDDNQLRMATNLRAATSMAEYQALRNPVRANANAVHAKLDQAFAVFAQNIKRLAKHSTQLFDGISVRKGTSTSDTWLYFKIKLGANASKDGITHKAYIGFNNVYTSLTPDRLYAFMQELRDKGFHGDLKVMQDLDQASSISDQIVMHGATEADAALGLREAQVFFGKEVAFAEMGVDSNGKSYSENLAAKIKDGIAAKEQTSIPSQKKVDEITQDTAEDMSLLTDEELADPKTRASIERNVTRQLFGGEKEHNLRSLSRGLAKARKLTLAQQARITAVLDNPRSFLKKAPGNPVYIKNFYARLDLLVKMGNITDVDRRIILASTVNTSFSSNVAAKISDIGTRGDTRASTSLQGDIKIGKLDTSVEGNTRVENVLHEIGHVEELHAYGQSLMDLRKLFTSEQAFLDTAQEVLGTDNFNKYYIAGNTQELMAQVKAKMMIDEVKLAVFLKTTNSTVVEKTLLNHVLRIGTSLIEVFASLKLSKVDAEDQMYTAIKEILYKLETGAEPLMTRVTYHQRVAGALKEFPKGKLSPTDKAAFTKAINTKISEDFKRNDPALQDMLFTKDEVQSLHALTVHSDGSVDPIRLDAYLNVKRDGITVKSKAKFAKTFQSYVEINQRYLASTTDIYIASMKENGYKAVPSNPIVMDASLSKRDQIAALREYHRELAPDEMLVTPSYLDVTFGNFNGDLALQFLIDSSTEPTVMFAPMEGFVSKLRTMVGINNETLESIVGGVEIDPKHMGKALQMLNVDKMITIEQIKIKLAETEMVIDLSPVCITHLTNIKHLVINSFEDFISPLVSHSLLNWIEKTVLNMSVGKRDEAMLNIFDNIENIAIRINGDFNSLIRSEHGSSEPSSIQVSAEKLYKTKTIAQFIKETKQWVDEQNYVETNTYSPTKQENIILKVKFNNTVYDARLDTELGGTEGTWQRVLGVDVNIEAQKMGHCVLQYKESIDSGRTDVYSLRDADNNPLATVGIKYDGTALFQATRYQNKGIGPVINELSLLLKHLDIKETSSGITPETAKRLGLQDFNLQAYKQKKLQEKIRKNPNWEKELVEKFVNEVSSRDGVTSSEQSAYLIAGLKDGQASPIVNNLLQNYVEKTNKLPKLRDQDYAQDMAVGQWYMDKFKEEEGLPDPNSFAGREFAKGLEWIGNVNRNTKTPPLFLEIAKRMGAYSQVNADFNRVVKDALEDHILLTVRNMDKKEGYLPPTFQYFIDNLQKRTSRWEQRNLYLQLTDKNVADAELPMPNFYKSIIKYMGDYQKEYDALYNLHGRGFEFQKAVDASDELSKQVDLIDQKAQRLNIFIEEQRSIAIEQLEPLYGWASEFVFDESFSDRSNVIDVLYDPFEVDINKAEKLKYDAYKKARDRVKEVQELLIQERDISWDDFATLAAEVARNPDDFVQPPPDMANDLFAPEIKKTPATKEQLKFIKDSVITEVLRHNSTLPNGIKFGLDGGESSLGAGVYLSPDLGDARNYPTDVYVNITKPLVVDTTAYIQSMPVDPRLGYVPFSSTANVFNHHMAMLMQQFISEKGLVVDPSWLKNLEENMVHPMRNIPQVIKEALDLTDGQWQKSYSRLGIDQSISSNILDDSVLLKESGNTERQQAIIAQHNNDSSITVSDIAEPRIVAHRLMQRMGYDGVVAKNFQNFDYNGKAMQKGKDIYVALDTASIMPQEEMFAPVAQKTQVVKWAEKQFGNRRGSNGQLVSENFIAWFGNSKVVDADGNPLVVYHATRASLFNIFSASTTGLYSKGNYFATLVNVAENFIKNNDGEVNLSINPAVIPEGGRVIPVYVSIKKPFLVGDDPLFERLAMQKLGLSLSDLADRAREIHQRTLTPDQLKIKTIAENFDNSYPTALTELLQEGGFDGIQVMFGKGDSYFIAFDSSQSKSSIANSGDFDSLDPNIMFAPKVKPTVAYTPELVVQRLAFLSKNLTENPVNAADFKTAMQGMFGMNDELFDALAKVKVAVKPDQMAEYHQAVIRRTVDALMAEKLAVGPEGVRRLNAVEREMNPVRASKQIAKTKEATIERAKNEPVDNMPEDTTDSTLYPNNPMNATMLENFWLDSGLVGRQVLARLKAKGVNITDGTIFTSLADKMSRIEAKGIEILVNEKTKEIRSRNALINYIVLAVQRNVFDTKGTVSRAGLTPASWSEFLATENDIIRTSRDGGAEITFDGTPTQHLAAEKKKDSELYQRFKKAYSKAHMTIDESGIRASATATKTSEAKVSQVKAEGLSISVDYATSLGYDLFSKRDRGWQKFVITNLIEGKSYAEIAALANENGFNNKKANNVTDAVDAVRARFRAMLQEETGMDLTGMTDDQVQATGVLEAVKEKVNAANAKRETAPVEDLAPERKSSAEILAETEKSTTEQANSDELTAALDTKEPTSQPVIAPEGSKGPVTAVVQVDGEAVGPLTPHVAPKTAEAVAKNPKTPKAQFTSSTPKKVVVFTTGDARAMLKATGNVGKLFFASMKTMEGLLNALPKSALKDTDIAAVVKILKKMIAAGEEKAAVAKFLALMKHLDIEAVKVIDPKDGRTVMNFIFADQAWSYGGISRFTAKAKPKAAAPKTAAPKTAAPKTAAAPKEAAPKEAAPKEAAPTEAAPAETTTEAAPDGTQVPVMEPKEVPSNEIAGGSVVPVISEHDRLVTGLTEGNEALRDGGVDATSFTALFKKYVRSLSKDAKKKLGTELPEGFKDVFMKFVELNAAIMHDNRALFGDHKIVDRFWKQVDIMLAVEDGLQMKDTMRVRLTMKEIYAMAAAHVSTKQLRFLPPLTHENITIKNGKFGLRNVSKETQGVLARRDTGPIVAYTPEELAARKAAAAAATPAGPIGPVTPVAKPKGPPTVEEILAEDFNKEGDPKVAAEAEKVLENSDRIDTIMGKIKTSFTQLLRQNNVASWVLGGSERANRNRWRTWMSMTVNALQHASKLGLTIRAENDEVRFMAMFMDDSRAMTGQLVAPNGTPIRSAAKSKQDAVMFTANLTRIHHALEAEAQVLKLDPMSRKLLQKMQIVAWQKKTTPTAQEMSSGLGGGDFAKMAVIMENYRKEMLHLNTEMLKLEEKTGWRTVTKNGKPVEADSYLPIQLHMQKLMAAMGDNQQYDNLTRSIVATRRATKMADENLDRNTLITMGIMNLEDNSKFYTQDRTFALTNNITLDADTLKKLKKFEVVTTESTDFTKTIGKEGRDFFIIQEGGKKATVYAMPTSVKDLSDADLKKYYDTISGDQTHVTKVWKEEFNNKGLIEVEMKELLDFKSRQGRYHHTKNSMVNSRPVLDGNHHDEAFSTVRNFSVEELISDAELFKVARTDLHAAYQNFSRYRMFDLLFQESVDQLSGSPGLRPKEFFRMMEERIKQKADKMAQGMPQEQRAAVIKDIEDGIGRLVWQYAEYNGTIPRSGAESRVGQNIARTFRGLATTSSGLSYGLSQSPELVMEILKNMPQTKGISVPKGLFNYITNLLKVWDRKDSATKYKVGDLITSLEEYSKDHSTHFNEGIADIDFDTDINAPYRAIWNSGPNSQGMTGQVADFFQRTGQTAVLAGGVSDSTNHTRYYAKARHVRDLVTMMRDGKLKEFLRLRELPENKAAMQKLLEGSFESAAEERKLWKKHKELCRLAHGLDPFNALKAVKAGLDTQLKLEAMMYGMNAANALDGVLDFRDLHMVYRDLKNMKNPPIDPELYRTTATDFQYGVEGLIRKRSGTHSFGLNQNLSVFHTQDEVGKLINTLTTYMRSWFDDVALNAPERGAVGLMFGGIISVAVVETIITLLREWMSGREMEDMIAELENDPAEYILKFVTRMPIFGVMTPVFEGLLKTGKYLSGGAQNNGSSLLDTLSQIGGGSPNIGVNSAMSLLKTTGEAGSDLITGAIEGDTKLMAKGALRVPGHFFNKTIYAAPVRIMEEQMDLDDKHTAQFIIDGLQKKPYRYLSQQRGGSRGGSSRAAPQAPVTTSPTAQTMPQSAALKAAQRPEMGRQVKEYVAPAPPSKPNSGVSERLGKLLDNPSYTPTPPM